MKKTILILFIFLFINLNLFSEVKISAVIDKNEVTIGDTLLLTLQISYTEKIKEITPAIPENLNEFEILDIKQKQQKNKTIFCYTLATYTQNDSGIPAITINYQKNEKLLTIKSLELPVKVIPIKIKENSTIKDISKPILKKYNFNGILILLGIIILILAIIFIIIYLFRKKNKLPIVNKQKIFINPYDLALQKLNKLKKYSFNDLSDFQYFAFEISYITREYLSSILEVECLELSNTELKEKLISYDFNLKKDFFENNNYLELIKFAKFKPPIKKIESIINFTETFLIENNKIKIDEIT